MTDVDVYSNPLSWSEIRNRFEQVATPTARVVISTEETCWFRDQCKPEEAQYWLDIVRNATGNHKIRKFANSQYMGERPAVIDMLQKMLETGDRQKKTHK